jgi:hypothetical protein
MLIGIENRHHHCYGWSLDIRCYFGYELEGGDMNGWKDLPRVKCRIEFFLSCNKLIHLEQAVFLWCHLIFGLLVRITEAF